VSGKKQQIIQAAMQAFSEKGYRGTSIQDIADVLGIAKGSLYFYFKSKEDLLLSIIKHQLSMVVDESEELNKRADLEPRELLYEYIIHSCNLFEKHKSFFTLIMQEKFEVTSEIHELIVGARKHGFFMIRQLLLKVYGEQLEPYASDASVLLQSFVQSYVSLAFLENQVFDLNKLASFIMARTDAMVRDLMESGDILLEDEVLDLWSSEIQAVGVGKSGLIADIDSLKAMLDQAGATKEEQQDIASTLDILVAEFEKPEPQSVVIKGMLALLKTIRNTELKKQILIIEEQILHLL